MLQALEAVGRVIISFSPSFCQPFLPLVLGVKIIPPPFVSFSFDSKTFISSLFSLKIFRQQTEKIVPVAAQALKNSARLSDLAPRGSENQGLGFAAVTPEKP
jgi:hypothetical protein